MTQRLIGTTLESMRPYDYIYVWCCDNCMLRVKSEAAPTSCVGCGRPSRKTKGGERGI